MTAWLQEKAYDEAIEDEEASGAEQVFGWRSNIQALPQRRETSPAEFRFGRWCLVPAARLLLREGEPVEVGSRAFDLLHLLVSKRGVVVEKDAITRFVWPSTIVEESNLRFQMAALRRVLGAERSLIKTIPGRGYIFAIDYRPARPVPELRSVGQIEKTANRWNS